MAIAADSTSTGTSSGTSITVAHTVTGTNTILWTGVLIDGDKVTSVTCNGVTMTQMAKTTCDGSGAFMYLYYLANPTTGNVVMSCTSSAYIQLASVSYTGAKQTGIPDAQVTNTELGGQTSITTTVTVVAANSWLVGMYRNNVGAWTAGANTVNRAGFAGASNATIMVDTNGAQAAGSRSMTATCSSATVTGIMASFAPFTTNIKTVNGLAIASVKTVNGLAVASVKTINGLS